MTDYPKPIVVVSKCLGFDKCRWNGATIPNKFIEHMKDYVKFKTVCPEMEIGLGAPRKQIGLVIQNKEVRLIQHETLEDVTDKMVKFTDKFLDSLGEVDGFILKEKSPSCGMKGVKVYPRTGKVAPVRKDPGFFGGEVVNRFGHLATENDGRLNNFRLREHFLTVLFTIARFRKVKRNKTMNNLVKFHSQNKLLFMAYNQTKMRELGRIVANHEHKPVEEVFGKYEDKLYRVFNKMPRHTSNINVMMHALGYFSDDLNKKEKAHFLDTLEKYRNHQICRSAANTVLNSWILRFDNDYLSEQTFFRPYPEELIEVTDSGKGREFRD